MTGGSAVRAIQETRLVTAWRALALALSAAVASRAAGTLCPLFPSMARAIFRIEAPLTLSTGRRIGIVAIGGVLHADIAIAGTRFFA